MSSKPLGTACLFCLRGDTGCFDACRLCLSQVSIRSLWPTWPHVSQANIGFCKAEDIHKLLVTSNFLFLVVMVSNLIAMASNRAQACTSHATAIFLRSTLHRNGKQGLPKSSHLDAGSNQIGASRLQLDRRCCNLADLAPPSRHGTVRNGLRPPPML